MKRLLFSFLCVGFAYFANAQAIAASDAELQAKTKAYADEVFAECMQYTSPLHLESYKEYLSRVSIETRAYNSGETYIPLSTILFKNKCNLLMVRDNAQNFNPQNFNPLKYFFNFETKTEMVYRVDNTAYVIVIHPKP
jgi:hypothetical protein